MKTGVVGLTSMKRHLILGPPGTGKTTRLLEILERAIQSGVKPELIAYVSFTRAAVREARGRAAALLNVSPDSLPYFRTLHSMCFRQLGLRRNEIFTRQHQKELGELLGENLDEQDLDGPATGEGGGALMHLDHFARATGRSLKDCWHEHGAELDWYRLRRFSESYELFREDHGLLDFTDLLGRYAQAGDPVPVELAIVDEAQDLTPLQWRVVERAFGSVPELYVAGDDDQCIYRWSGASSDALVDWPGTVEVLAQSYRLPAKVHRLAHEVALRIGRRTQKTFASRAGAGGIVEWVRDPDEVDLERGTWLLLARTRRQLKELREVVRARGLVYTSRGESSIDTGILNLIRAYETLRAGRAVSGEHVERVLIAMGIGMELNPERDYVKGDLALVGFNELWHDALTGISLEEREYYLACLRRGENLLTTPRVRIETIHGAKGLEADHVLLLTSTTRRIERGFELDPDAEHRVFYVGVTRAKEGLWLVPPTGPHGYQI